MMGMTWIHLHMLLNGVPAVIAGVAALLFAGCVVVQTRSRKLPLLMFVVAAAATIVTYATGELATREAAGVPGITAGMLDQQRALAWNAVVVTVLLALIAVLGLVKSRNARPLPRPLLSLIMIASFAATGMNGFAAYRGERIHDSAARESFPPHNVSDRVEHPKWPEHVTPRQNIVP